jgi:transcriptional/translational regulatory protein YebC/TACO1
LAAVLEAGAEDVENQGETFEILTDPSDMVVVRESLQAAGIEYDSADSEFIANLDVPIDADTARKVFKLIEALEDSDDVQNVFANFDLSPEVLAELEQD